MTAKNKKKKAPGVKVIEIKINTHFIKVCAWAAVGCAGCFAFFTYVHIAEHMKPAVEAFATGLFGKIGDAYHKND